jgi:hypothetical protein
MELERLNNYFLAGDDLDNLKGTKEAKEFFNEVCLNTINGLKKYYFDMPADSKEHGFEYREQQMQSFLTPAISTVTNGSFLQECPIDRIRQKGRRTKKVRLGNGRLDYWANYDKCSFLIEVKHNWIRYYPSDNYFTFYSSLKNRLDLAVEQIDKMYKKTNYNYRNRLFALGLVVAPIFVQDENVKKLILKEQIIKDLENKTQNIGANVLGFWSLEKEFLFPYEFEEEGKKIIQFYPGLAFIGKIKKVTRN